MVRGKVITISVVSLILVVGVVIGVVVVVHKNRHDNTKPIDMNTPTTNAKAVESFCVGTTYKDVCVNTLKTVAKNQTATPMDYLSAIILATLDVVKKSFDFTNKTIVNKEVEPYEHMAIEDCKNMLNQAIGTLQASYSMVGNSDMHTIHDRANELRSWMTSVYALQSICKDQIQKPEYKSAFENGMINATQLTNNAVDVIAELSDIFKALNVSFDPKTSSRRLMGLNSSYPSWFEQADRRLLRGKDIHPNVVVAKDGSGKFNTIQAAINAYPANHQGRFIIHVKAGLYRENVVIDSNKPNIMIYGDGPGKTIVTGNKHNSGGSITTVNSATFANNGFGFIARHMTFRNEAGPENKQAVALLVNGHRSAVFHCNIEGYQDSLYYQTSSQFYRNCVISGTIDFIFGMGDAVVQNSKIIVRKPSPGQSNVITADGRELPRGSNGLVLQNCEIVADKSLADVRFNIPTYLGRPWKKDALTVVMKSDIGDLIRPEGWIPWSMTDPSKFYNKTCQYYEFENRGVGAASGRRSKLFPNLRNLTRFEAPLYTPEKFLDGKKWLKTANVPHNILL